VAGPLRSSSSPPGRFGDPGGLGPGKRILCILGLALIYLGAAKTPFPSGLPFQAYLFWPAAAVAHTAFFILGAEAVWGLALGSLALNLGGWLPWPHALAMVVLQTLEPLIAWRILVRLGVGRPDLRQVRDLLRWLGVSAAASAFFSAGLGAQVVGLAHRDGGFRDPLATSLSWFLGDLTALLCLGPVLLHAFIPREADPEATALSRLRHPVLEGLTLAGLCLLLLFGARINPGLSRDVGLALQFALVLPMLGVALRFGPRGTSWGVALLSLSMLALLWVQGRALPQEAFRFSQLYLMVLALAALITAAAAEEARAARRALEVRELQGQRMEAVATLAGGLVHGFNNQLTVLLGNLDRLRLLPPGSPEATIATGRMEDATLAMERTVHQLKALSHQAPLRAFSLPLREALAPFLLETAALPDRIDFQVDLQEGLVVGLDPELLRQALQLLVANAVEALSGAGQIQLRAEREDPWVRLILEDDGPGMTPEVLRRACDPFFTTRSVGRNRGLGLSIAFSLARQMGGWLTLHSRPGEGTRAELGLPQGKALEPLSVPPLAPLRTRRILLADDEAGIRELTQEVLQDHGFEVVAAADGQEALEAFEADPSGWDLVILDLVMPRLHGADVLSRIRSSRPNLPALLISGYNAEARPGLLEGPYQRFLAKPFRIRDLVAAMEELGLLSPEAGPSHDR
jgi:signal transduction histidine kinase/ActR/RegA family two-component response regulator